MFQYGYAPWWSQCSQEMSNLPLLKFPFRQTSSSYHRLQNPRLDHPLPGWRARLGYPEPWISRLFWREKRTGNGCRGVALEILKEGVKVVAFRFKNKRKGGSLLNSNDRIFCPLVSWLKPMHPKKRRKERIATKSVIHKAKDNLELIASMANVEEMSITD